MKHRRKPPDPNESGGNLFFFGIFPAGKLHDHGKLAEDPAEILSLMGDQTVGAVLDPLGGILEVAAAFISQRVQRAVAEQSAEGLGIGAFVAGEIFAFPVLGKVVMGHFCTSGKRFHGYSAGGGAVKVSASPVTGWRKESFADHSAISQGSSLRLYLRSPTSGSSREENWQRI